jgi:hypothetical protein
MGSLFHKRRWTAFVAAAALLALTALVSTAMTCADGRPCEMLLFMPRAAAAVPERIQADPCCAAMAPGSGSGAACIADYGGCAFAAGVFTAISPTAHQPVASAMVASAWAPVAPRLLPLRRSEAPASHAGLQRLSPPGIRGPPSC